MEYGNVFEDVDNTRVWDNSLRLREEPGSAFVIGGMFRGGFFPIANNIATN
jgi:hypothetical protein